MNPIFEHDHAGITGCGFTAKRLKECLAGPYITIYGMMKSKYGMIKPKYGMSDEMYTRLTGVLNISPWGQIEGPSGDICWGQTLGYLDLMITRSFS